MYNVPQGPHAPPAPPPARAAPSKRYPALRFIASTCIFSAWATLVLSVILGILIMVAGGNALGASASLVPGGGVAAAAILGLAQIIGGLFGFLVLFASGELIYVSLDNEENTRAAAQAMTAIARRMGIPI